ncbi:MAG: hypothetical protein NT155_01430 [Candidatus Staskawiczbacteria bacterium]|nr:hypothetical protein [Candidatus Staskawiczbacteria bacterium]
MTKQEEFNAPEDETQEQKEMSDALKKMATGLESGGLPQQEADKEGFMRESLGRKVQGIVNESRLPNEEYKSTVGVYGGKIKIEDGKMVWDTSGVISKIDKAGDAVLRTFDEHTVREPWKLLKSHPKWFLRFLAPGTKRYRGGNEEVAKNIERLGLSEYYGPHENGIEIKKPEIYTQGVALQDVYRSDMIKSDKLKVADRFQALAEASKYIGEMHDKHGAVGEILVSDIIFQENEDGKLGKPVLNMPDIIFNKEKVTSEKDKKATDLLDFLSSAFTEEYRRSQKLEDADRALDVIISNYGGKDIIVMAESFIKRGRLTLQGDAEVINLPNTITKKVRAVFSQHNKARLGSKTNFEGKMKKRIEQACEKFLSQK